ncbi:MAG: T9SS type A sorting domain-containing protein [Bacteroidia bacterium]|nr:T9SS type A sorting domain-containing protein [Bacteroidia bacterium]
MMCSRDRVLQAISLVFLLCLIGQVGQAQTFEPCKDTLKANPFSPCYEPFDPVCGCDGELYRNVCDALRNGINPFFWGYPYTDMSDGFCAEFAFDIVPNPVQYEMDFNLFLRQNGPATVQIYDIYGTIMFERFFNAMTGFKNNEFLRINVEGWEKGVYFVIVIANGRFEAKNFLKLDVD